jgi:thiopeptide-type bacteriocin biosynthesis protein
MQFDVALFSRADAEEPFVPWAGLADEITKWRISERFDLFHFTRKPPGLRLRFAGGDLAARLEPYLLSWLASAERRNDIRSFRRIAYEPETYRFGGEVGMAIAHKLFDADSEIVLNYEQFDSAPGRTVRGHRVVALSITHDLLCRGLDDEAEVWDVWKRLESAIGADFSSATSDDDTDTDQIVHGLLQDPDEAQLFRSSCQSNHAAAEMLRAAVRAGEMSVGSRSWLTAAAIFQWNRWGLPRDRISLSRVVTEVTRRLEPDQSPP